MTGRDRGSAPDVEQPDFAIEVKYGAVMSARLQTAVEQAEAAAEGTDKTPLVCITNRKKGSQQALEHFVMMRAEDFVKWIDPKTRT